MSKGYLISTLNTNRSLPVQLWLTKHAVIVRIVETMIMTATFYTRKTVHLQNLFPDLNQTNMIITLYMQTISVMYLVP